ncbi:MAG: hypothetical protein ACRD0Z_13385 [Acidimicrobiales bacterium]
MRALREPRRPAEKGLTPFRRTVAASVVVDLPFGEVERATRVCLAGLVREALPYPDGSQADLVVAVSMRRFARWLRVPVEVEVLGAYRSKPGAVAHLRWRGCRHRRILPVMEADLLALPRAGRRTELVLEGSYEPPLGTLGLLVDVLVGRNIARSTASSFVACLGRAFEGALGEGRCSALHDPRQAESAMSRPGARAEKTSALATAASDSEEGDQA